jgi:hypothetical protein
MSFQLEVEFSGLALYVVDNRAGKVAVLMPDCRRRGIPEFERHLDGRPAEPHVGYIRMNLANIDGTYPPGSDAPPYRKSPEYELIHRFDRQALHFDGQFGAEPTVYTPFEVPNFNDYNHDGKVVRGFARALVPIPGLFDPAPPEELLMRLVLAGGSLKADADENDQWTIPRRFDRRDEEPYRRLFASTVKWTRIVDSHAVTVRITDFSGANEHASFNLKPVGASNKVTLKVANLCAHNPLEWAEMRLRKVNGQDLDFKWLYRLLKHPTQSYSELLLDDELPVPEYIGQLASGSDDCMPGRLDGTVP